MSSWLRYRPARTTSSTPSQAATTTTADPRPTPAAANDNGDGQGKDDEEMAVSTLDLVILTFNCAKSLIDAGALGSQLHTALEQSAGPEGTLPDLVVFSLQEVAPLSYSFIGGYFLTPYFARFDDALNQAAVKFASNHGGSDPPSPTAEAPTAREGGDESPNEAEAEALLGPPAAIAGGGGGGLDAESARPLLLRTISSLSTRTLLRMQRRARPYTLVRARNVGMTAMLFFARDPALLEVHGKPIELAEVGFGAASMGNKGAVGIRCVYTAPEKEDDENAAEEEGDGIPKPPRPHTELTFVATHLASMEWNLRRRNGNWRAIVAGLTFADPRGVVPPEVAGELGPPPEAPPSEHVIPGDASDLEDSRLMGAAASDQDPDGPQLSKKQLAELQAISLFKPSSHVFLAGDLNYRISSRSPPALAPLPNLDRGSEHYYTAYLPRDQLTAEREAGRTMHGLAEDKVRFPPTYKYMVERPRLVFPQAAAAAEGGSSAQQQQQQQQQQQPQPPQPPPPQQLKWRFAPHRWPSWTDRVLFTPCPGLAVRRYDALPVQATSDHRPVFWRADVPLLDAAQMAAALKTQELLAANTAHAAVANTGLDGEAAAAAAAKPIPDPRLHGLPFPVDLDAYTHRAAARRREVLVGWSMFLWATKEGAAVLGTSAVVLFGGWWIWGMLISASS